jgi:signal transduction histidine kinase
MLLLGTGLSARVEPDAIAIAVVASVALSASAGLLATVAGQSLRFALAGHEVRSMRTIDALADYQSAACRESERRHDALSALAAIRSSSEVLTSTGSDLQADLREDLAAAVRAELSRIERMLSKDGPGDPVEVDLRQILDPVVLAWRQRGMQIRGLAQQVLVRADPDVVARIVNNLLDNAHRHALGARVRLVADHTDGMVHLSIVDSGPGVPRQRRSEVFLPGASWHATGEGQGLGLASARRLADEHGGRLRLLDFDEGCWFVLTLPGARSSVSARGQDGDQ